ncbi:hypothetical protein YC2023_041872 [Brassica napus]
MDANVTANCVHPGIVRTRLTRDRDGLITDFVFFLTSKLLKSVPQAAATTCCLATSPRLRNVCGKYFSDCNEARTSNPDRAILKLRDYGLLLSCWSLQLPLPIRNLPGRSPEKYPSYSSKETDAHVKRILSKQQNY